MTTVKLDTGKSLSAFLTSIFQEGLKSSLAQKALEEKDKQLKTAGSVGGKSSPAPKEEVEEDEDTDVDSLFGGGGGQGAEDAQSPMPDNMPEKPEGGSDKDDDAERLKKGDVTTKDIVEKMNSIRSGKSFKDSAVSTAIDAYVDKLKTPEKTALMAFLSGIAQIVTGEVPGQNAEAPASPPADVKMQKTNEPKTVHKRPNVIKGPGETSKAAPNSMTGEPEEDSTPPTPIVPKKRGV